MGLLSSIAAALSQGVGNGMVASAKWGIEEEAQRKKEAADDARLKEQLKRYDDDRQSRDKYYAGLLEESKNERLSRAEQARLDRESNERIAGMRASSVGGSGESSSLRELKFIDSQITSFDNTIEDLNKAYAAEGDKEKQKAIAGQIDTWRAKRQAFVTSDIVRQTIASNGKLGQLYGAALYGGASTADPAQAQEGNIPASLVVPPPRAVVKPEGGLGAGLLSQMQSAEIQSAQEASAQTPESVPVNTWDTATDAIRSRYGATGGGNPRVPDMDFSKLKAPQGGWRSPIRTKEVQYKNGQKGYTFELAD